LLSSQLPISAAKPMSHRHPPAPGGPRPQGRQGRLGAQ